MSLPTPTLPATLDLGLLPCRPTFSPVCLRDIEADAELNAPPPDAAFVDTIRHYRLFYGPILRLIGSPGPPPHFEVIDGRRRVLAARIVAREERLKAGNKAEQDAIGENLRLRGIDPVEAIIFPQGYSEKAILAELLNLHRSDNLRTSLEAIERWQQFPTLTETDFASRVLHCSLGTLRRRAQLLKLRPALRDAFMAGQFSQAIALELARMPEERQDEAQAQFLANGRFTGPDLAELRRVRTGAAAAFLPLAAPVLAPFAPPVAPLLVPLPAPNFGGHHYPGCDVADIDTFTSDCAYGCGCWMGAFRSGGPDGVDPRGACPNLPSEFRGDGVPVPNLQIAPDLSAESAGELAHEILGMLEQEWDVQTSAKMYAQVLRVIQNYGNVPLLVPPSGQAAPELAG